MSESTRTPRWRRWAPPFALIVLLVFAGATIARAAIPPVDDVVTEVQAPDGQPSIPALEAPAPTVSPEPFVSPIEVVLPPPPPPPPAATSPSGRSGSSGSLVGTDYVAFCNGGGGSTATASTASGLLAAANAERARFGFRALRWSETLASTARGWSATMASSYDPANPGAALRHGQAPVPGGQNVAAAWATGGSLSQSYAMGRAHAGWMASSGHCKNLLNPAWSVMGAGTAVSSDGKAWYTTANLQ